jgi:L-alanine-DL-glutamate epimerase-like enolase superfamily enzyme
MTAPTIVAFTVYPVAGRDSMELNLSGAHEPYFTRNVLVLEDSNGNIGIGEVPGGQNITRTLHDCEPLVLGRRVADYGESSIRSGLPSPTETQDGAADLRPPHHDPCGHRRGVGSPRFARSAS